MRKNLYYFILLVFFLFSCQGKKSESQLVKKNSIACNILGVNLSDNTNQIKEKLTNQGYHWEEEVNTDGLSWIGVKDDFSFSGYYFTYLTYLIYDAKIFQIHFRKEFDSPNDAQKFFEELCKKIDAKYSEFNTQNVNDNYLSYKEYNDGKISLSVGVEHHEQEKILPFFDKEDIHNAREYWKVIICYDPIKTEKNTNNF